MNDALENDYAPIGRRSIPRRVGDVPASGSFWSGPTRFVIKEEIPGAFRWIMISGDGRELQLAQSPTLFATSEACRQQIIRLDPDAEMVEQTVGSLASRNGSA